MYEFSDKSKQRMSGVNSRLQDVASRAIEITAIDFGIPKTGGLRSSAVQLALYKNGVSKADGVRHKSKHQDGQALDVFAYVDGKASWEVEHLAQVAAAFMQAAIELNVKIKWGGFFKSFTDMPHFEIVE